MNKFNKLFKKIKEKDNSVYLYILIIESFGFGLLFYVVQLFVAYSVSQAVNTLSLIIYTLPLLSACFFFYTLLKNINKNFFKLPQMKNLEKLFIMNKLLSAFSYIIVFLYSFLLSDFFQLIFNANPDKANVYIIFSFAILFLFEMIYKSSQSK